MASKKIKIDIESHTDETLEAMQEAIEKALVSVGLKMERNAKIEINKAVYDTPESPSYKRTGRLRASITFATSTAKGVPAKEAEPGDAELLGEPDKDTVYVGTNVEYAPYVEFGTSKMKKRPYLKPAVADHISEYKEIIEDFLKG